MVGRLVGCLDGRLVGWQTDSAWQWVFSLCSVHFAAYLRSGNVGCHCKFPSLTAYKQQEFPLPLHRPQAQSPSAAVSPSPPILPGCLPPDLVALLDAQRLRLSGAMRWRLIDQGHWKKREDLLLLTWKVNQNHMDNFSHCKAPSSFTFSSSAVISWPLALCRVDSGSVVDTWICGLNDVRPSRQTVQWIQGTMPGSHGPD